MHLLLLLLLLLLGALMGGHLLGHLLLVRTLQVLVEEWDMQLVATLFSLIVIGGERERERDELVELSAGSQLLGQADHAGLLAGLLLGGWRHVALDVARARHVVVARHRWTSSRRHRLLLVSVWVVESRLLWHLVWLLLLWSLLRLLL